MNFEFANHMYHVVSSTSADMIADTFARDRLDIILHFSTVTDAFPTHGSGDSTTASWLGSSSLGKHARSDWTAAYRVQLSQARSQHNEEETEHLRELAMQILRLFTN